MARAATTLDPFNAVAEPKRRQMLSAMGSREQAVGAIGRRLGWPQPQVSKHLGVLRRVGLVTARREGQRRFYRVNGMELKPIHDWVKDFEHFWREQLAGIKARAEAQANSAKKDKPKQEEK